VGEWVEARVVPGRTAEVVDWARAFTEWRSSSDAGHWMQVLCDPQTSGGLLMAVPAERAAALRSALAVRGVLGAQVGRFGEGRPGSVAVA